MSAFADVKRSFSDIVQLSVAPSSSGANTLLAAVTGRKIRVLAASISAASAVNVKFQSGTTPDISKLIYLTTGQLNVVLPYNPFGWFETAAGALLGCDLSGGVVVGMQITYVLI